MTLFIPKNASNILDKISKTAEEESLLDRGDLFLFFYYALLLEKKGLNIGHPFIKEIRHSLWELRPGNQRYFFTMLKGEIYLLHSFRKRTRNTPSREVKKAVLLLDELNPYKPDIWLPLEDVLSSYLTEKEQRLIKKYTSFMIELVPEYNKELLDFPRYFDKGHIDPPLLWALSLIEKNSD